jgi:type II restriction enzyme
MGKWTRDLRVVVQRLPERFSLADVYAYEVWLTRMHPNNRNIRAKIRQQLQILRDMGELKFTGPGQYRKVRSRR